jgi:D-alanyl-D-alanine carboxypeptidase
MRSRVMVAAAACGAAIAVWGSASSGGAETTITERHQPAYAGTLQRQIPRLMKANAIPGVVVLIKSPSRGNWSRAFGTAVIGEHVPMSLRDSFRIGSNTKTMTSTVILQLAQDHKLKLNDSISKFVSGVPNGQNITIAELSEMRSGLYSYSFDPGFNATLDNQPGKAWSPRELLRIAFAHPADFAPGTQYEYSNTNIVLLGLVIQKLTGMPAAQAFQRRIFAPLGMKHTFLPTRTERLIPAPHAQGYQFGTNVATINSYALPPAQLPAALSGRLKPINDTNANPSWAWTAGGAISTPADLARYVKALVGGGLLDKRMQRLRLHSIRPTVPGQHSGVGYGLGIAQFAPGIIGHDGQIPGYSSFMVYDTKTHDTIIVAANLAASPVSGQGAAVVVAKTIIATLYGGSVVPKHSPAAATARLRPVVAPPAPTCHTLKLLILQGVPAGQTLSLDWGSGVAYSTGGTIKNIDESGINKITVNSSGVSISVSPDPNPGANQNLGSATVDTGLCFTEQALRDQTFTGTASLPAATAVLWDTGSDHGILTKSGPFSLPTAIPASATGKTPDFKRR